MTQASWPRPSPSSWRRAPPSPQPPRRACRSATGDETVVELSYRIQATPWLRLQPGLQYFFKPHFSRRNALAFGANAAVVF